MLRRQKEFKTNPYKEITATILTSVKFTAFSLSFSMLCSCQSLLAGSIYSALAQSVEHAAVNRSVVGSSPTSGAIPVMMATRIHLFPFRTQKLSSSTAKVLSHPRLGRIASCRISEKRNRNHKLRLRLFFATCYPTGEDEGDSS